MCWTLFLIWILGILIFMHSRRKFYPGKLWIYWGWPIGVAARIAVFIALHLDALAAWCYWRITLLDWQQGFAALTGPRPPKGYIRDYFVPVCKYCERAECYQESQCCPAAKNSSESQVRLGKTVRASYLMTLRREAFQNYAPSRMLKLYHRVDWYPNVDKYGTHPEKCACHECQEAFYHNHKDRLTHSG